jgi:hypothetical protein
VTDAAGFCQDAALQLVLFIRVDCRRELTDLGERARDASVTTAATPEFDSPAH